MLDAALVRDRFDDVKARLLDRGAALSPLLEALAALDARRRQQLPVVENLKRDRNQAGEEIARLKRQGGDATALLEANKQRAEQIKALDAELEQIEAERRDVLLRVPNLPHASVPRGASATDNLEVRRVGEPRAFSFTPKPHYELGPALGILDFERAARMSGSRFAVLQRAGARLARALIDFMLDLHTREHGYTEVAPPLLVGARALVGTGNLPKFEEDLFRIAGDWDLYLIPTAEVPLTNLHREETLEAAALPLKYTAHTPCFRSEAGSYGRDTRGMIRQHQFDKVEIVQMVKPEDSYAALEALTAHAETILQKLGLPYRKMLLCTGDMGFSSAKTYDLEVWLPAQNTYREISSCSNFEAFQARRMQARTRNAQGKPELLHTLNGSGLAVGRTLVAILENYQNADGSVDVPEALAPYLGGSARLTPAG